MARKAGNDGKLYVSATAILDADANGVPTNAEVETPTYTEVLLARSVTTNLEGGQIDVSARGDTWDQFKQGRKRGTLEFELVHDSARTEFNIIADAFFGGDEIAAKALDGDEDTTGSAGLVGNFVVTSFSRNESDNEAMTYSVTLSPSSCTAWYEKAGT